jgi:hypothetical protein
VSFTETVYVTGSPTLLLETGGTDRAAVTLPTHGTATGRTAGAVSAPTACGIIRAPRVRRGVPE